MRLQFCLTAMLAMIACRRDDARSAPPPSENLAPAASAAKRVEPSKDLSAFAARLRYESEHRPHTAVSADAVFDALARAGITLDARRQYAGFTMKASYCAGGRTADGVAVAVCEYPTSEAADAGKAYMDREFSALGTTARRMAHGATVLTVAHPLGARYDHVASRALSTFAAL